MRQVRRLSRPREIQLVLDSELANTVPSDDLSSQRGQHDVAVLDVSMITLEHDGAGL